MQWVTWQYRLWRLRLWGLVLVRVELRFLLASVGLQRHPRQRAAFVAFQQRWEKIREERNRRLVARLP